ncbi:MAG: hypothetical protein JRH17_00215 [Deltaproteobacteria bacterium]|nr:hypothetical protein [Deltaproteobacteria bacterium]MBW2698165.1 hypothetical protein [Deltaproteobacteria bacterium]
MTSQASDPTRLLENSLESGRIHSAYLISGAGEAPRHAALWFARGVACTAQKPQPRPCGECPACHRSQTRDGAEGCIALDGTGKSGPLYRHIGEHADLYWIERGRDDTRVRIGQIRALQKALRLGANEGGWRVAVVAEAEWLNAEAQNALLRLLEEPPPRTCLILVSARASALLATIRSRSVKVVFPSEERPALRGDDVAEETAALVERFDGIVTASLGELVGWAEEYRGPRASSAEKVDALLALGSEWLRDQVHTRVRAGERDLEGALDAWKTLSRCRRDLATRNANPQMIAEKGLIAVRLAVGR